MSLLSLSKKLGANFPVHPKKENRWHEESSKSDIALPSPELHRVRRNFGEPNQILANIDEFWWVTNNKINFGQFSLSQLPTGKIELGEMASPNIITKRWWSKEPRMVTMSYMFPFLLYGKLRNMVARRVIASIVHRNDDTIIFARYVKHVTLQG
jgi:hypothetical protein